MTEHVQKTGAENDKQVRKLKTRCYYTDFVNHCIKFYLSTPDALQMEGKRKADVDNWLAVQYVFRKLSDDEKQVLTDVYKAHYRIADAVKLYCDRTGTNEDKVWILITKTAAAVAKSRGLV